jgi:capsular exopolysaccharide synthesis family protein
MSEYKMQEEQFEQKEINLLDYWLVILKRKWLISAIAITVFLIVSVYTYTRTPIYTSKGQLLIEKEPNILTFEEIFQVESFQTDYYQTQYKLLQSRSLADRAVEKLKLYEHPEFVGNLVEGKENPKKNDPVYRASLVSAFLGRLTISPVRQTRLVDVSFRAADPKLAADGVNALFDSFINMSIESRFTATEQATEFLTQQIASLRSDIERKETQLQAYAGEKNIVALSDKETTIVSKLAELNTALTQAQIERVNKEAYYNEIKNASPDYIPSGIDNPLITNLKQEYARLSRDYSRKQGQFGPEYPEIQRLKTDMESTKKSLETETKNLVNAAYSDFQAALKRENSMQKVFNNQKQESIQLNSNAISYNTLKNEIENNKSLLDTLSKRQSETGVSARLRGVGVSNIKIVDRAEIPRSPSSPNKRRNLMMGLFLGLMGGLGLAFLLEYFDSSVKGTEDIERYAKLPALGIIPNFDPEGFRKSYGYGYGYGYGAGGRKKKNETLKSEGDVSERGAKGADALPQIRSIDLITQSSPKSNFSESYRSIRTALLLSSTNPGSKIFVLTSPLPSEGKTSTISNLAVAVAQTGKRVLLLDADLRKPRQHKIFRVKNLDGLTNYLTGNIEIKELLKTTSIHNLFLINAGPVPPNPAELLGSEKMAEFLEKLKQIFDIILIDTPPILAVTDALVLATKSDGIILVVWGGKTSREALKRAREKMDLTKTKAVGVILNRVNLKEHDYYYKHHYYHYYGES